MPQTSKFVVDENIQVIYSHAMFILQFLLTHTQQYHDVTTYYNFKMFAITSSSE